MQPAAVPPEVYSVAQVAARLKALVEADELLGGLWVEGEVSNLRRAASGHAYFTLKDREAMLRGVMFRARRPMDRGDRHLQEGALVIAHGRVAFYAGGGSIDLQVDLVRPAGEGELALERERLKAALAQEGLFDQSRKRPLPPFPAVIGVVTSPGGAALRDIQNVLGRRFPLAELRLSPTLVQGDGAPRQIVEALERLESDGRSEVIIIARGGGSLEDLQPFNDEAVARAIFACRLPLISGVGHETDETIADLVADRRAPTPSAAAELAVPDGAELRRALRQTLGRMSRSLDHRLHQDRATVDRARRQLENAAPDFAAWRRRIDDRWRSAAGLTAGLLQRQRLAVEGLAQRLNALSPQATLRRGFSIVELAQSGAVVSQAGQVSPGDALRITVADGTLKATANGGPGADGREVDGREFDDADVDANAAAGSGRRAAAVAAAANPGQRATTRKRNPKSALPPSIAPRLF